MNILQLIPAVDWYAIYDDGNGPTAKTIACFALVKDPNGVEKIVGFDGGEKFSSCEHQENFRGYYHLKELESQLVEEVDEGDEGMIIHD